VFSRLLHLACPQCQYQGFPIRLSTPFASSQRFECPNCHSRLAVQNLQVFGAIYGLISALTISALMLLILRLAGDYTGLPVVLAIAALVVTPVAWILLRPLSRAYFRWIVVTPQQRQH
jgi:hypothetical protein